MGFLLGHLVPGTALGLLGIWWSVQCHLRYYQSLFQEKDVKQVPRRPRLKPHQAFKLPPLEVSFRIFLIIIGISDQLFMAQTENDGEIAKNGAQHMTMMAFFIFPAVFDLMHFYRVPGLPDDMDLLANTVVFSVEGLLFFWHLHGRSPMDVQVHTFLVYVIALCALSSALEVVLPNDIRVNLLRSSFTLLQGTWLYNLAFVLYPPIDWPIWDENDHKQMMTVTLMFAWNIALVFVIQIFLGISAYHWVKAQVLGNDYKPVKCDQKSNVDCESQEDVLS